MKEEMLKAIQKVIDLDEKLDLLDSKCWRELVDTMDYLKGEI